jgi:hypothetical protein
VKKKEPTRVVVGVEADKDELQAWGRAAALRKMDLDAWIKQAATATAIWEEELRHTPTYGRSTSC